MSTILRALPVNLSVADLQEELRKTEADLIEDGHQIKANLISLTLGEACTDQSPDKPVPVNVATFEADTGQTGDTPGPLILIDQVPSTDDAEGRNAFFQNLKRSPLTFVCFSDVLINGQSCEIVTCRDLPEDQPPLPPVVIVTPEVPKPVEPQPDAPVRELTGGDGWTFSASIVGDDIVVKDIVITCFGGNGDGTISDPQDNGQTASGINTKNSPIRGVSIAMDGRQFPSLSGPEHDALDGAPIPRLREQGKTAWNTLVEVTIDGRTFVPPSGIVDLGPGRQASSLSEPHALDLTPLAAAFFSPNTPLHRLSSRFEARGSFRIIGGAKLIG